MKTSALEGRTPLLFSDLHDVAGFCLFCGDRSEGRYMCSQCRPKSLWEIFLMVRAKS